MRIKTGEQFRAWRKRMCWTQQQAADALGYEAGKKHISLLENDHVLISRRLELACRFLALRERHRAKIAKYYPDKKSS